MGHFDTELIAICEEILEDGEVSSEEISRLGGWLEQHEEARGSWPGEALIAPVRDVLLDGKVNKTELRRIAGILRRIQKEWVARQQELAEQAALQAALSAARQLDLAQPRLPLLPVSLKIRSHSDRTVIYKVDLAGPSCTCPDWRSNRNRLPIGDLTRCCKHILDALGRLRPAEGWPGWVDAFLELGWKPHPQRIWSVHRITIGLVLMGVGGNEWADVYVPVQGMYHRFGYNLIERRWTYGESPPEAAVIERLLLGGAKTPAAGSFLRRFFGG